MQAQTPPELTAPSAEIGDADEARQAPPEPEVEWDFGWHPWKGFGYRALKKTGLELPTKPLPLLDLHQVALVGNIGGRLEVDGAAYDTNDHLSGFDSGFDLRRARLTAQGGAVLGLPFDYRVDLGYVPGNFTVTQAYVRIPGLPHLGSLEIGQFTPASTAAATRGSATRWGASPGWRGTASTPSAPVPTAICTWV